MDAKQISKLKEISDNLKKPDVINSLSELFQLKATSAILTKKFVEKQKELSNAAIKINEYIVRESDDKLLYLDSIIENYKELINKFDKTMQDECMDLYQKLNAIDKPSKYIIDLYLKSESLELEMTQIAHDIEQIESVLPAQEAGFQMILHKNTNFESCDKAAI